MTTPVAEPVAPQASTPESRPAPPDGQRFLLQAVNWHTYETLLELLQDRLIRLTYDRGNLELMSPSYRHKGYAHWIGRFLDILTLELDIAIRACGSTTFRREDLDRGIEPDKCYYIRHAAVLEGSDSIDLSRDPPPDLAVEIDISRSWLDRMGIYAALGIPEVWCFDGKTIRVYQLVPEGKYELRPASSAFPFLPLQELVPFLLQSGQMNDTQLARSFLAWVRDRMASSWKGSAP